MQHMDSTQGRVGGPTTTTSMVGLGDVQADQPPPPKQLEWTEDDDDTYLGKTRVKHNWSKRQ